MKAEKRINRPVNVIEKVAIMVDQVKDLQQKIDEANNNICRLMNQFMGKNKANRKLQQKDNKEEIDMHHSEKVQEAQNRK
jgi:hypothetical protein